MRFLAAVCLIVVHIAAISARSPEEWKSRVIYQVRKCTMHQLSGSDLVCSQLSFILVVLSHS